MAEQRQADEGAATGAQVVDLVPWERALRRARQADRAFGVRSGKDPGALEALERTIGTATPLEAYYALKRRGLEEVLPVLGALSAPQLETLFDIEAWKGDTLEIPDVLTWLEAFRVAGHAPLVRAARALGHEGLATLFRRRLLITYAPKEDRSHDEPIPDWLANPPEEIEPIVQTPDGRFMVAARARDERDELDGEDVLLDEEERKQVMALVRELYLDEEWEVAAGVLRTALDDLTSNLEEDAYRFRCARIEDHGFPPRERAIEVYGPLDPAVLDGPTEPHPKLDDLRLPLMHVEALSGGLLETALRGLSSVTEARVEGDLLALASAVLVADRVDAGDVDGVEDTLRLIRAYLELALAHGVSGEQIETVAVERLRRIHPQALFRVGHTLVLRRRARARALLQHSGLGGLGLDALSLADRGAMEPLLGNPPQLGLALEPTLADPSAPLDAARSQEARPFRAPGELAAVDRFLDELEALGQAVETLGLFDVEIPDEVLPSDPQERDIDVRLGAAAAQVLLGRDFAPRALSAADLAELADLLGAEGRFDAESVAERGLTGLHGAPRAAAERRLALALAHLGEVLHPLIGQERIEPRFVTGCLRAPR